MLSSLAFEVVQGVDKLPANLYCSLGKANNQGWIFEMLACSFLDVYAESLVDS